MLVLLLHFKETEGFLMLIFIMMKIITQWIITLFLPREPVVRTTCDTDEVWKNILVTLQYNNQEELARATDSVPMKGVSITSIIFRLEGQCWPLFLWSHPIITLVTFTFLQNCYWAAASDCTAQMVVCEDSSAPIFSLLFLLQQQTDSFISVAECCTHLL